MSIHMIVLIVLPFAYLVDAYVSVRLGKWLWKRWTR